jgi:serine/threonine-protein kinase
MAKRLAEDLETRRRIHEAEADRAQLLERVLVDASGVWARRSFQEQARRMSERDQRAGRPSALLAIGFDRRQNLVDQAGKDAWDRLVADAARALEGLLPELALMGRAADDELAIFLPGMSESDAFALAGRLFAVLEGAAIGVAGSSHAYDVLERQSDVALRAARRLGRDQVRRFSAEAIPSASIDARMPQAGWIIDRKYSLEGPLSKGGMGVVYRALDLHLERPVAIKMLRPELLGQGEFREMLRSEASRMASVRHPSLAAVYAFGEDPPWLFLAMELISGSSVFDLIHQSGPFEPRRAAEIVSQIAGALEAVHAAGLVHRDVKPANILVTPATPSLPRRAVLVDFGIARRLDQSAVTYGGTRGFMAPETRNQEPESPMTDVYALAATAYTMLIAGLAPDPPAADERIAPELMRVLLHGLEARPTDRPASALAFARAFEEAARKSPTEQQAWWKRWTIGQKPPPAAVANRTEVVQSDDVVVSDAAFEAAAGALAGSGEKMPLLHTARALSEIMATVAERPDGDKVARNIGRGVIDRELGARHLTIPAGESPGRILGQLAPLWSAIAGIGRLVVVRAGEREATIALEGAQPVKALRSFLAGFVERFAEAGLFGVRIALEDTGESIALRLAWGP